MQRVLSVGALAPLALACSVAPPSYTTDAEAGSLHAVVVLEERAAAGGLETSALAVLLRLPAAEDLSGALATLGREELLATGKCLREGEATPPAPPGFELLDMGDVELEGPGVTVPLVPRAFPTVSNLASGVVYTTPDRAAGLIGPGVYRLRAAGGQQHPGVTLEAASPAPLAGLRVGGLGLDELEGATLSGPLALEWAAGEGTDRVLVEVESTAGPRVRCSFGDAGEASVPEGLLPRGSARLRVRRVRDVAVAALGVDGAEVRFAREVTRAVQLAR